MILLQLAVVAIVMAVATRNIKVNTIPINKRLQPFLLLLNTVTDSRFMAMLVQLANYDDDDAYKS